MIPKIAHFYWGGSSLPYLRYMTIKSFCKYNPEWDVYYYYPAQGSSDKPWPTHEQKYAVTGDDYTPRLKNLPIAQVEINWAEFRQPTFVHSWAEVHKSDFLRWMILGSFGGLWSDMDIIYFRPIYLDLTYNTYVCSNLKYRHSIGFLLSSPDNQFFAHLRRSVDKFFAPDNYQSVGSILINAESHLLPLMDPYFINLPMDVVYAYDALTIPEIYVSPAPKPVRFTRDTIGLHWYAGYPMAAKYVNIVTEKNFKDLDNVLGLALQMAEGQ